MYNYFVFENGITKERVIVKQVHDKILRIFKLRNKVTVGKIITFSELRRIRRDESLRYLGRYKSYSNEPAPINFESENFCR